MKKTILAIGIIGIFLLTNVSTSQVTSIEVDKNETEKMINFGLDLARSFTDENGGSAETYPAGGSDGFIDPIFFKTCRSNEFDSSVGHKSAIYNNNMYVTVYLYDTDILDQIGILKYDITNGNLVKGVLIEGNQGGRPMDIIVYQDHIYILVEPLLDFVAVLLKLDLNLDNIIDMSIISEPDTIRPISMTAGYDGIYIAGRTYDPDDVFLAKFDANCNPIWNPSYRTWEKGEGIKETLSESGDCLTIYDGHVYLTGFVDIDGEAAPCESFILKYDTNGNLVQEVIGDEYYIGTVIEGHDGRIYVSYEKISILGRQVIMSAYDTNLNPLWSHTLDGANWYKTGTAIAFDDDYLYLCGMSIDLSLLNLMEFSTFIFKCNIHNNGNKEWLKIVEENDPAAFSIHTDNDYLYLSGATLVNNNPGIEQAFVLKCTKEGGDILNIYPTELSFGSVKKGKEVTKPFTIENQGDGILNWEIKNCPSWAELSDDDGSLGAGESTEVTISINTENMMCLSYKIYIIIETDDGDNEKVEVAITVSKSKESTDSTDNSNSLDGFLNRGTTSSTTSSTSSSTDSSTLPTLRR